MTQIASDDHLEAVASLWRSYASEFYGTYSPLYANLARVVADDDELLALVMEGPPHAHDPNMLLAAVHYLVVDGLDHPLASCYAETGPDHDPAADFKEVCLGHRAELLELMATHRIQTNECNRSAPLALGLVHAAERLEEPLALVDAGTSAGLNLLFDQYHLDYGSWGTLGRNDSPVHLHCEISGADHSCPFALPTISSRLGIDRNPMDVRSEDDVKWLLACVWPGSGRIEHTAAALEIARKNPPPIVTGDLLADLPGILAGMADGPVAITTSWVFSYLSMEERPAFINVLADEAMRRPVAWIFSDALTSSDPFALPSGYQPEEAVPNVLGCVIYDGNRRRVDTLATVHHHGRSMRWLS